MYPSTKLHQLKLLQFVAIYYFNLQNAIVFCRPTTTSLWNIKYDPDVTVTGVHVNMTSPNGPLATLNYLRRFGYLEEKHGNNSEGLYSEDAIEKAIREMQKFGDIPQTGYMDNATIQLLSMPRCGVPDIVSKKSKFERFVIGAKGWNKRHLTYRIENWTPKMYHENVKEDMAKAFSIWAAYAGLQFSNKSSDKVDISISFGRGNHNDKYPFDGSGGVLAHAYFPYHHGTLGGDIHFDDDENWVSGVDTKNSGVYNPISFLAVATHELGHSLGLAHSHDRESVMFPYYQSTTTEPQLAYDDIMAVYQLYIQRELTAQEDEYDEGSDEDKRDKPEYEPIPSSTTRRTPSTTYSTTTLRYAPRRTTTQKSVFTTTEAVSIPKRPEFDERPPELCKTSFDTISFIRNEIFVFKGEYMWRISDKQSGHLVSPFKSSRLFSCLEGVKTIDAAYENEIDGKILFFSGNLYWIFDGTAATADSPRPITDLGLPESLQKLDGAFIWEKNHMTYFFSGSKYWRYNETLKSMDEFYPQNISKWTGVPNNLDAVMRWKDGKTNFFKNNDFWQFNDAAVKVDDGYPQNTHAYWFGCHKSHVY